MRPGEGRAKAAPWGALGRSRPVAAPCGCREGPRPVAAPCGARAPRATRGHMSGGNQIQPDSQRAVFGKKPHERKEALPIVGNAFSVTLSIIVSMIENDIRWPQPLSCDMPHCSAFMGFSSWGLDIRWPQPLTGDRPHHSCNFRFVYIYGKASYCDLSQVL